MKKNNIFLGFLTFMFILNALATILVTLGINTGVLHSLTIAILMFDVLTFGFAMLIVGGSEDGKKESGNKDPGA